MKSIMKKIIVFLMILMLFFIFDGMVIEASDPTHKLSVLGTSITTSDLTLGLNTTQMNGNAAMNTLGLLGTTNPSTPVMDTEKEMVTNTEYKVTYKNAFSIDSVAMDLTVTVKVMSKGTGGYAKMQFNGNKAICLRAKNARVRIYYKMVKNSDGSTIDKYVLYGVKDVDGGDLMGFYDTAEHIYYINGPKVTNNSSIPTFDNYYYVIRDAAGKVTDVIRDWDALYNVDYEDGTILPLVNASSEFMMEWYTTMQVNSTYLEDNIRIPIVGYFPITYNINYVLNNGTHGTYHPTSGTYGSNVYVSNPSRTGYRFNGWTLSNGDPGTALYGATASTVTNSWNPLTTLVKNGYMKNLTPKKNETVTLNANWVINTSKLTVNPNGGTVKVTSPTGGTQQTITSSKTYTQNYNTTLSLTTPTKADTTNTKTFTTTYNGNGGTPERTNDTSNRTDTTSYTFSSWTKSSTFYGTLSSDNKTYTFPSNNNVTSTITAAYTSSTTNGTVDPIFLPNATKEGYHLTGWNTKADGTGTNRGAPGATYRPSASETLYAQWAINTSKLKVNPNGGSVKVTSPTGGTQQTITTTTTYTQNYNTTLSLTTPTKADQSTPTTYTVTYKYNDGATADSTATATRTVVTGYTFSSWTKSSNFYGTLSSDNKTYTFPANNNVTSTITAKYTSSIKSDTTTSITLKTPNNRTGYTFKGWYSDSGLQNFVGNAGASYTPTDNITLYGKWTATSYRVVYNGNGGTQYDNANLVARFDGLYNNVTEHSGNATTWKDMRGNINAAVTGGTWGDDYLSFNGSTWVNLGQINSNYQTIEVTFSANAVPTAVQDIIGNWQTSGGGIYLSSAGQICGQYYINGGMKTVNSEVTVEPNIVYHVALTYDGSTLIIYVNGNSKKSLAVSGTIEPPLNSTIMVMGGDPNGSGINKTNFVGKIYNASIYDAARTESQITSDGKKIVTYNSTYGTLPTPVRTGYTFNGWYTTKDFTTKITSSTPVNTTGNRIIYAKWTASTKPQLTIDPNGGSVSVTPSGGSAQTITDSTSYEQTASTTLTVGTPTKASTSSTTTYTISYNGNSGIVATTNASNTTSNRTDTTTYMFSGWTKSPDPLKGNLSGTTYTFPTDVTSHDTITASYTPNPTQGTQGAITLAEVSKLGYTFLGWYTAATGGTRRGGTGDTYTPSGNETLYAQWSATADNYSITYNLNGGTNNSNNPTTYNVNSNDITILSPTKTGYTFTGWQKTVNSLGWVSGYIFYETGEIGTTNTYPYSHHTGLISLKEGVQYTISNLGGYDSAKIRWKLYTSDGTYLGSTDGNISGATCTPTQDCYARILFYAASTSAQRNGVVITGNGLEEEVIIPTGSTGNIALTANWRINTSTLRVDPGDGETRITDSGGEILSTGYTVISEPTEFVGNYNYQLIIEEATKQEDYLNTIYSVTYNFNGNGEEDQTDIATKSETIEYIFDGWSHSSLNGTLTSTTYQSYPVDLYTYGLADNETDVLTAAFTENIVDNGTTELTLPEATWEGHTFTGWYTQATGGTLIGLGNSAYTPTSDITMYAHWILNTATVTIRKDNSNWNNNGINIALYKESAMEYSYENENVVIGDTTVTWSGIESGTYDIYASKSSGIISTLVDTGIDIVISGVGAATIDYYTLTLNSEVGISAVSGAGIHLKNQAVNIDADVSEGYTWEGWSVISGNSPD